MLGINRSSHQRCSVKKGALRNFAKLTGRHLRQNLFFNKVADLRLQPHLKRDSGTGVSCEFCEISKNTFFTKHPRATTFGLRFSLLQITFSFYLNSIGFKEHNSKLIGD